MLYLLDVDIYFHLMLQMVIFLLVDFCLTKNIGHDFAMCILS